MDHTDRTFRRSATGPLGRGHRTGGQPCQGKPSETMHNTISEHSGADAATTIRKWLAAAGMAGPVGQSPRIELQTGAKLVMRCNNRHYRTRTRIYAFAAVSCLARVGGRRVLNLRRGCIDTTIWIVRAVRRQARLGLAARVQWVAACMCGASRLHNLARAPGRYITSTNFFNAAGAATRLTAGI
jgi:hypothetical protein